MNSRRRRRASTRVAGVDSPAHTGPGHDDGTPDGWARTLTPLAGCLLLTVAVVTTLSLYESVVLDRRFLAEGPPNVGWWWIGRSVVALPLSLLIVGSLFRLVAPGDRDRRLIGGRGLLGGWLALAAAAGFMLILVADPATFSVLAREDHVVEWASALAMFAASGLMLRASVRQWWDTRHRHAPGDRAAAGAILLFAGCAFVTGMEEVSWLQRVLGTDAPEWLADRNYQAELNLHNLATGSTEFVYYVGGFVLLILLPFAAQVVGPKRPSPSVSLLTPSRAVIAVGAPIAAFNYDMWDILPIQMSMMTTVLVTGCCMALAFRQGRTSEAWLFGAASVLVVAAQLALFALGDGLVRVWDPTEYKELFIAVGLAGYAWEISARVTQRRRNGRRRRPRGRHHGAASSTASPTRTPDRRDAWRIWTACVRARRCSS